MQERKKASYVTGSRAQVEVWREAQSHSGWGFHPLVCEECPVKSSLSSLESLSKFYHWYMEVFQMSQWQLPMEMLKEKGEAGFHSPDLTQSKFAFKIVPLPLPIHVNRRLPMFFALGEKRDLYGKWHSCML